MVLRLKLQTCTHSRDSENAVESEYGITPTGTAYECCWASGRWLNPGGIPYWNVMSVEPRVECMDHFSEGASTVRITLAAAFLVRRTCVAKLAPVNADVPSTSVRMKKSSTLCLTHCRASRLQSRSTL